MKQKVSPHNILLVVTASLLLVGMLAVQLAINHSWLGLELAPTEAGVRIVRVVEEGPSEKAGLHVDDVIVKISSVDGLLSEIIQTTDLMIEPDDHSLYQSYFAFFEKQSRLASILSGHDVVITTANDKNFTITPAAQKPVSELSFYFWFQLFSGFSVVLMGAMVWVYASDQMAARLYMLAATWLLFAIFPSAIYTTRELVIDGELFELLSRMNQLGVMLFCGFGNAILWYFPSRVNKFPFLPVMLIVAAVFFLLNILHVYDSMHLGVRLPILLWLLLDVVLAVTQWKRTASDPVARAQVKWFILAWFIGPVIYTALNVFPLLIGAEPILTQETGWVLFVFVYLGIAFGLTKYRLFNLDKWILTAWFWFLCGLAFILVDALIIAVTSLAHDISLMLVLAITGWLYFPLRQLTLDRVLARRTGNDQNSLLPELLTEILVRAPDESAEKLWPDILQRLYQPLKIENLVNEDVAKVEIENHGQILLIPALSGCFPLSLYNAQKGARLFSPDDAKLIESVWMFYSHVLGFQHAQLQGAVHERRRIARDLHDDVSAKVLSLVYRADNEENADLARDTLSELRNVIHDLESPELSLLSSVKEWRLEGKRRCEEVGLVLQWQQKSLPELDLLAVHKSCLRKIFRESLSNVIKHANAKMVSVKINYIDNVFTLRIEDDGKGFDLDKPANKKTGIGLNSMSRRMMDLGGKLIIDTDHGIGCAIEIALPLGNEKSLKDGSRG